MGSHTRYGKHNNQQYERWQSGSVMVTAVVSKQSPCRCHQNGLRMDQFEGWSFYGGYGGDRYRV